MRGKADCTMTTGEKIKKIEEELEEETAFYKP